MLDHMIFAHEMDDGSVNTNYQNEPRDESNSNDEDAQANSERVDENGSSNDTSDKIEIFDRDSGDDTTTTTTTHMESVFETNDDDVVLVETVECNPDFGDNVGETTLDTSETPSKSPEIISLSGVSPDKKNNNVIMNHSGSGEREENEEVIIITDVASKTDEASKSDPVNTEIETDTNNEESECRGTVVFSYGKHIVYDCNDCWYFSTNKKDIKAHKQLHAKRGALYNCAQCVFNVTKAAVLYNHYRYGHLVEEAELQYPEDSIVRAGQRDMIVKLSGKLAKNKAPGAVVEPDDISGPPMVWFYNKDITPSFSKVYKCRYCPHTNRRRHNTLEHERMHSDHPDHVHHRQQQQRSAGSTMATQNPLHPCKRCTYVCNNAGVLASHTKVHSTTYGSGTVGFYDVTVSDSMQMQALELVLGLEHDLLVDKDYEGGRMSPTPSGDNETQDDTKYTELDLLEIKFCSFCPARFFFHNDLWCHIRLHKFRHWRFSCECCSFTARARAHVERHEAVHRDEYSQRTDELISSGYLVSQQFPRPMYSQYPASVIGDSPPQIVRSWSPSESIEDVTNEVKGESFDSDDRQHPRAKRLRHSEPDVNTKPLSSHENEEHSEVTKRRRRSETIGVAVDEADAADAKIFPPPRTVAATRHKSSSDAAKTTKPYDGRQFKCDLCPGRFFKASALQYHKTLHGGPGRHHCRRCDYAVSTYGNLVRHESVHRDLPARKKAKIVIYLKETTDETANVADPITSDAPLPPPSSDAPLPPPSSDAPLPPPSSDAPLPPPSSETPLLPPPPPPSAAPNTTDDDNDNNASPDKNEELDPEFGPIMLGNPSFYYPTTVKNGVSRPKRYKCPKCPSAFDKRNQYAVHLTLHGARDKYQCDKCDYSVRYTANYVQHQRKHARDAEIRKNHEQAASRAETFAAQEEASNSRRKRPSVAATVAATVVNNNPTVALQPRDTKFRNEISDRQTAYELNAAYGSTGAGKEGTGGGESFALFRCTHCPYQCSLRAQLDRHIVHHLDVQVVRNSTGSSSSTSKKRQWKLACRFCSYRTQWEFDLTEHTRVHFLRSTGVVLASLAATPTNGKDNTLTDGLNPADHVEFHGKRVVNSQRRRENEEKGIAAAAAAAATAAAGNAGNGAVNVADEEEPFFVFKDRGSECGDADGDNCTTAGKAKRFSPDGGTPPMLIDFNDNRTSGNEMDKPSQPTSFVRFVEGGELEFLDDPVCYADVVETTTTTTSSSVVGGKKKKCKK